MANITTFNSVLSSQLMNNIELYKNNPSAIQRTILNYLQNITNGTVDIVDPTNPFVFLLEASTVTSAAAINEVNTVTAKLYPSLAVTNDDLYLHMSDTDYLGVFSTPSYATMTFAFNKDVLKQIATPVPNTPTSKVTIPRNSEFTVSTYSFTLEYPIDITFYDTGDVLISWDATITSPIRTIGSYIIDFDNLIGPDGSNWISFDVDIDQIKINSTQFPLSVSEYFEQNIAYTNKYYYARVYYQANSTNGAWSEIKTTYTDQVFDPSTPTALIKVLDGSINVAIPQIYINSNLLSGVVRVDLYTTLGQVDVNLSIYPVTSYTSVFKAIDEQRDITPYTNVLRDAQYAVYSNDVVAGGSNSLTFNTLRSNVISDSIGERILPITNTQVESYFNYQAYELIKNVDLITNREFIASRSAPKSTNEYNIPSLLTSIQSLVIGPDSLGTDDSIFINGQNYVITPDSVFLNDAGMISLISSTDRDILINQNNSTIVTNLNSAEYIYTPFYYLIDVSSDIFDVRVFDMDSPITEKLSYLSANATAGYRVSTSTYIVTKKGNDYIVTITTSSDDDFKKLDDSLVSCQMLFMPFGQNIYAYQSGVLKGKDSEGNRVYTFTLTTNYNFDENNTIDITTFAYQNLTTIAPTANLYQQFEILYTINDRPTGYLVDESQAKLNKNLSGFDSVVITNESFYIKFGTYLENLWVRSRSISNFDNYLTYDQDIPLTYTEDMFLEDPAAGGILVAGENCTLTYQQIAKVGDDVYDANGNLLYLHRKGDTVLDQYGNPVLLNDNSAIFTFDMVFYDLSYKLSTDPNIKAYTLLATESMVDWIANDIPKLNDSLLEQSIAYFYPTNTPYQIDASVNGLPNKPINAKQTISCVVYLTDLNYNNLNLKQVITENIASIIRTYLTNTTLSKTELLSILNNTLTDVKSISVDGFLNNNELAILNNNKDRFMFKRIPYLKSDNTISIKEDIVVKFLSIESK